MSNYNAKEVARLIEAYFLARAVIEESGPGRHWIHSWVMDLDVALARSQLSEKRREAFGLLLQGYTERGAAETLGINQFAYQKRVAGAAKELMQLLTGGSVEPTESTTVGDRPSEGRGSDAE